MIDAKTALSHFRRQRLWTLQAVSAIPDAHFDWAPSADSFSLGDLVRHLVQAERFWGKLIREAVAGNSWDPYGLEGTAAERMDAFREPNLRASHDPRIGTSVAQCLENWRPIQAKTEALIGSLTDEQLNEVRMVHPLVAFEAPVGEMLLFMVGHEAHHRGQITAYLKFLGAEQPPTTGR